MSLTASEINKMKYAQPSTDGVLPVILERWSPRVFSDRDVSPADLKTIFEAARWAPSSYNEQPWRYFVGTVTLRPTRRYSMHWCRLTRVGRKLRPC